jgi:UDP-N-acetylglucosamine 2-epimerase (non-hydrolysing)
VTDRLANLLLTPSRDADEALLAEGEPRNEIVFVGNVMVDSLFYARSKTKTPQFQPTVSVDPETVLVTLHRPSNVDDESRLRAVMSALGTIARDRPVIFPVHPRTHARLHTLGLEPRGISLIDPLAYLDMVSVLDRSSAVVTDSGGLQEETTALGIPCFTLRANTERPTTITEGTNRLVPDPHDLPVLVSHASRVRLDCRPEGWDGKAGERVVSALLSHLGASGDGRDFVESDDTSAVANVA